MVASLVLFILSSALAGYALLHSGPVMSELMSFALVIAVASLLLFSLHVLLRPGRRKAARARKNPILVDGSNVMHWQDGTPKLATVCEVIAALAAQGFTPGVVFDANAGYRLIGKYQGDRSLAKALGLPADRVFVAPKGTPADPYLLSAARGLDAQVVTNDRYRDWAADHPEVLKPGFLIKGGYRDGKLWLEEGAKRLM